MSSSIQTASESIGESVKERRRHPDTLLFVDENYRPLRKCGQKLGNYYLFIFYCRNYTQQKVGCALFKEIFGVISYRD